MSFVKTKLRYERVNGATAGTEILEVKTHNNLFVFNDLINTIRRECDASIEKEAGGAVYDEWLVLLKSRGRHVNASWNWYGISFSAGDDLGLQFLQEIEEVVKARKYWKWQVMLARRLG